MSKPSALVVIEAPGKKHTLLGVLQSYDPNTRWVVLPTRGHLRDLPKKQMGVVTNDGSFKLQWVSRSSGFRGQLAKAMADVDRVFLATDADREGEEIAAAVESFFPKKMPLPVQRLRIRSITVDGVSQAFNALNENDEIDRNLVAAQNARRALDRLFGYTLSPHCWRLLGKGMATGRVQSCVLHSLVQHGQDRRQHVPKDQTKVHVPVKGTHNTVVASSEGFDDRAAADLLLKDFSKAAPTPTTRTKQFTENPPRPCTTASVLRAAGGWGQDPGSAQRDLQGLYERGVITYPRTDNPQLTSSKFLKAAKSYMDAQDKKWWSGPNTHAAKTKVGTASSEAHEAIRPTALSVPPSHASLKGLPASLQRMYRHLWASTMAALGHPATREDTTVTWATKHGSLRATFTRYTMRGYHDPSMGMFARHEHEWPEGEFLLDLSKAEVQTFEPPPNPHRTQSAIVRWMEEHGVGRPATYAATIDRLYSHRVVWRDSHIGSTGRGDLLDQFLSDAIPKLLSPDFTARMERDLDRIAVGAKTYEAIVGRHWDWLNKHLPNKGVFGPACPDCTKPTRLKVDRSSDPFAWCGACKKEHPVYWAVKGPRLLPSTVKRHCPSCHHTYKHSIKSSRGQLRTTCSNCNTEREYNRL